MTRMIVMVINPGLQITPQVLPPAAENQPYSVTLRVLFGELPIKITIVSGVLPDGLTLVDNGDGTATISGTPTETGDFAIEVEYEDVREDPRMQSYVLQVINIPVPLGITGSLDAMTVGTPYSDTLTITGGEGPYSLGSTTLPSGISASLLGSTITVSGTPTGAGLGAGYSKSFAAAINITDANAAPALYSQSVSITVTTLAVTGTAPAGVVGTAYSYAFGSTGGVVGSKTFSYTGTLPPGLTLSSAGVLSGTPTSAVGSPFAFTVTATDGEGNVSAGNAQSVTVIVVLTYATFGVTGPGITRTNSNRTINKASGATFGSGRGSIGRTSGKPEFEITFTGTGADVVIGLCNANPDYSTSTYFAGENQVANRDSFGYLGNPARIYRAIAVGGGLTAITPTLVAGDIITVSLDYASNSVTWQVNGAVRYTQSLASGQTWYPVVSIRNAKTATINAGQTALAHSLAGYEGSWAV